MAARGMWLIKHSRVCDRSVARARLMRAKEGCRTKIGHSNPGILRDLCKLADLHFPL